MFDVINGISYFKTLFGSDQRTPDGRSGAEIPTQPTPLLIAMATLIDGTAIAKGARQDIKDAIEQEKLKDASFHPCLAIIQVGARPDSSTYVRMKKRAAAEAGVDCRVVNYPETISEEQLIAHIEMLNEDSSVNGILVQLPLPEGIDEARITDSVLPIKDVDGFCTYNMGQLSKKSGKPEFIACTPKGVMYLLEKSNVELSGKKAVVFGRSDIVGTPVANLLRNANATVSIVHSQSSDVQQIIKEADIVVCAIGKPKYIKGENLKKGCVVIDVGINYMEVEGKNKLVGDADFESCREVASQITPVPGGVGPMTVAMLLQNTLESAIKQRDFRVPFKALSLPKEELEADGSKGFPSDIAISRAQIPKRAFRIADELGLKPGEFESYGPYKGKIVASSVLKRSESKPDGKFILVTGITPTPLGEGKSTTTVGLASALGAHLRKPTIATLRQPSMGPTFGIKGGAAGGGYSQVVPMDEFNLHITGDIHAVGQATNLLAAAIDARVFHEGTQSDSALWRRLTGKSIPNFIKRRAQRQNVDLSVVETDPSVKLSPEDLKKVVRLDFNPDTITWRRVVDINDRYLRQIEVGLAPSEKGLTRKTGFDITVASEVMAALTLSQSLSDLRERLGKITVAFSMDNQPITCDDIGCAGAMTAILKDAINPNLMQTLEGVAVLVHCGPFANISIGSSSVISDKTALKLVGQDGYVVTEAGFDFTMGGERFLNIKCRSSGLRPDAVVIVATVRALKLHGGAPPVVAGAKLPEEYRGEHVDLVRKGCANLEKQIENARKHGLSVVVAINAFDTDTEAEHKAIEEAALAAGAERAVVCTHFRDGGEGAVDLARAITDIVENKPSNFAPLYSVDLSLEQKLETICKEIYGADGIDVLPKAQESLNMYVKAGYGKLPVCIAKTQYSLSHDPKLLGRPTGFKVPIKDVRLASGAGYLYALAGDIVTMPGLPTRCGFMDVEVEDDGQIEGMF